MAIRVDLSSGVAHIQIFGRTTWDDFRAAFTTMLEHPDFSPGMNSLWDTRTADFTQFTPPELLRFAEFVTGHAQARDGARGALVVSVDEDHGLASMYDTILEMKLPVHMRVFQNLADAEAWLAEPEASG